MEEEKKIIKKSGKIPSEVKKSKKASTENKVVRLETNHKEDKSRNQALIAMAIIAGIIAIIIGISFVAKEALSNLEKSFHKEFIQEKPKNSAFQTEEPQNQTQGTAPNNGYDFHSDDLDFKIKFTLDTQSPQHRSDSIKLPGNEYATIKAYYQEKGDNSQMVYVTEYPDHYNFYGKESETLENYVPSFAKGSGNSIIENGAVENFKGRPSIKATLKHDITDQIWQIRIVLDEDNFYSIISTYPKDTNIADTESAHKDFENSFNLEQ